MNTTVLCCRKTKKHTTRIFILQLASNQLAKAKSRFGERVLVEAGTSIIFELIDQGLIDQLELSVTPVTGGDDPIDWQALLNRFTHHTHTHVDGTDFYVAHN